MLLAFLLAATAPEHVFGDWAVACDRAKRCTAATVGAKIVRQPGAAGRTVLALTVDRADPGVIAILIDGRQIGSGFLSGNELRMEGGDAEGVARAMAKGRELSLRAGRRTLGRYSLRGSWASLRFIDTEQGRAGTLTALVAR